MTANEDSALAPRIHLYAEHLQNIRTLSIQASLATHSNTETTAVLAADGTSLSLTHEGETASIRLPISVPGDHNDATLHIPPAPSKELSFRLSLEEKPGSNLLGDRASSNSHVLPWTGADLTPETEICCAACESALVQRGSVKQWKDLPSENWAEMMDFWHCHKPDVPHEHDHDADGGADRGIGANSKLAIKPGVAMVGPLDLLFALENCQNVQVGYGPFLTPLPSFLPSHHATNHVGMYYGRFKEPTLSGLAATFEERRRDTNALDQIVYRL